MDELAIDGGRRTFEGMDGKRRPKIGAEEFIAIAERFGFKPEAVARLRETVSDEDLIEGAVNLARYYCPLPDLVAGPELEALAGGVSIFCDVDSSLHIDPSKIEASVTPRTVAVAPTHHWGGIADMDPTIETAREHGLKVVEDCAQSPGGKYRGRFVGTIGDMGCFSISAYKIIGGGEGGLITTNDQRLRDRACQLAECGGLWREDRFAPPRYEGELFVGTNYRMSELEAAVDIVQLRKLDGVVRQLAVCRGDCPVADDLYNRCINIMLDQWYSTKDCDCIAEGLNKVMTAYCTEDDSVLPWVLR